MGPTNAHHRDPCEQRDDEHAVRAIGVNKIAEIVDASAYDTSSRARSPMLGEIVVWQNTAGYYLAMKVEKLQSRGHGDSTDEITFTYEITPNVSS